MLLSNDQISSITVFLRYQSQGPAYPIEIQQKNELIISDFEKAKILLSLEYGKL